MVDKTKLPCGVGRSAGFAIAIVAIWLPNLLGLVEETTTQVIQIKAPSMSCSSCVF